MKHQAFGLFPAVFISLDLQLWITQQIERNGFNDHIYVLCIVLRISEICLPIGTVTFQISMDENCI